MRIGFESRLELLFMILVWMAIGFLIAAQVFHNTPSINCPQEDSCYYDYYDGAPHIFRVDD